MTSQFRVGQQVRALRRFSEPDVPANIHVFAEDDVGTVTAVGLHPMARGTFVEITLEDKRTVMLPENVCAKYWREVS